MDPKINENGNIVVDTPEPAPAPTRDDSWLYGVSVRGWLAILLIVTVCGMSVIGHDVKEPLYSLAIAALSFYFGHQIGSRAK